MSSGTNQTSQTTSLPPEITGIFSQFGGGVSQAMQMPYQQYQGPRVADLSPVQNQALDAYSGLLQGNPAFDAAGGMLTDTLMGDGGNPFTEQVANRATQGATDQFNRSIRGITSAYNSAGGLGSARHQLAQDRSEKNLATGLADSLGSLYSGAYENERNRQMQAAGLTGQLASSASGILNNALMAGDTERRFYQSVMDADRGDFYEAQNYPWQQLERGAGIFGALQGGIPRTTTTTGPGRDPVAQGLGVMAMGNALGMGNAGSKTAGSATPTNEFYYDGYDMFGGPAYG